MGKSDVAPACGRCLKPVGTTPYTTSSFNTQTICMDCKYKEQNHPEYMKAKSAETAAVKKGNMNFPGIGLPDDLRKKMFDAIIESEKYDELLGDAIWGRHDGIIQVEEDMGGNCAFCEEPLKKKCVDIADVGDSIALCLRCGKIFIAHAKSVIKSWIDNELTETQKEVAKALKGEE